MTAKVNSMNTKNSKRILKTSGFALTGILLVLLFWLLWYLYAPDTSISSLPGSDVSFERDSMGIYHIQSPNFSNAMEALGFLHGRDRGTSLLFFRAQVEKLAENLSQSSDPADLIFKEFKENFSAMRIYNNSSNESQDYMDSYIRGINKGLKKRPGSGLFSIMLGKPWTVEDSLNLLVYFNLYLQKGSNAWVSSSQDHGVILAADPHVIMGSIPGMFYAVQISIADKNIQVDAAGPPGMPFFSHLIGNRMAWGLTSLYYPFIHKETFHYKIDDQMGLSLRDSENSQIYIAGNDWEELNGVIRLTHQGTVRYFKAFMNQIAQGYSCPYSFPQEISLDGLITQMLSQDIYEFRDNTVKFPALQFLYTAGDHLGKIGQISGFNPMFYSENSPETKELSKIVETQPAMLWNANDIPLFMEEVLRNYSYSYPNWYFFRSERIEQLAQKTIGNPMLAYQEWQTNRETIFEDELKLSYQTLKNNFQAVDFFEEEYMYLDTTEGIPRVLEKFLNQEIEKDYQSIVSNHLRDSLPFLYYQNKRRTELPEELDIASRLTIRKNFLYDIQYTQNKKTTPAFKYIFPWAFLLPGKAYVKIEDPKEISDGLNVFMSSYFYNSNFHSASLRLIGKVGEERGTLIAIPPGQNERPGSRHFTDFIDMWQHGEYHQMGNKNQ
jgi:hypothetical protein